MLGTALAAPAEKFMAEAEAGANTAALSASVAASVISLIENIEILPTNNKQLEHCIALAACRTGFKDLDPLRVFTGSGALQAPVGSRMA